MILDLPDLPELSKEVIAESRKKKQYFPIAFDLYRTTAIVSSSLGCIDRRSLGLKNIPNIQLIILRGLLSRITRLMRTVCRLGGERQDKEAILILSRCILETATRILWILNKEQDVRFQTYLNSGLKAEKELLEEIKKNIVERGYSIAIEGRMMASIQRTTQPVGIDIETVKLTKMPKMNEMLEDIGDKELYLTIQRFPSSNVHGDWSDIFLNHLEKIEGELMPKQEEAEAEDIVYLFQSMHVSRALKAVTLYIIEDIESQQKIISYCETIHDKALWMVQDSASDEFIKGL